MKMNKERFEIIIKDLEDGKTICHEKTTTIMGAFYKNKGSQCFSLHCGASKPLFNVMLALSKVRDETASRMAENLADDLMSKLLGGENE